MTPISFSLFIVGGADCDSKLISIYLKKAGAYKKIFSEKAAYGCMDKGHIASLSDKGPYFYHFFNQTSATQVDEDFYPLIPGLSPSESFSISIWHGGVYFGDFDGDGTKEIITGLREEGYPPDLGKLMGGYENSLYRYTLYKWNKTKFDKLGEYFSFQGPPDD